MRAKQKAAPQKEEVALGIGIQWIPQYQNKGVRFLLADQVSASFKLGLEIQAVIVSHLVDPVVREAIWKQAQHHKPEPIPFSVAFTYDDERDMLEPYWTWNQPAEKRKQERKRQELLASVGLMDLGDGSFAIAEPVRPCPPRLRLVPRPKPTPEMVRLDRLTRAAQTMMADVDHVDARFRRLFLATATKANQALQQIVPQQYPHGCNGSAKGAIQKLSNGLRAVQEMLKYTPGQTNPQIAVQLKAVEKALGL